MLHKSLARKSPFINYLQGSFSCAKSSLVGKKPASALEGITRFGTFPR
jgi:hypothetical protein